MSVEFQDGFLSSLVDMHVNNRILADFLTLPLEILQVTNSPGRGWDNPILNLFQGGIPQCTGIYAFITLYMLLPLADLAGWPLTCSPCVNCCRLVLVFDTLTCTHKATISHKLAEKNQILAPACCHMCQQLCFTHAHA